MRSVDHLPDDLARRLEQQERERQEYERQERERQERERQEQERQERERQERERQERERQSAAGERRLTFELSVSPSLNLWHCFFFLKAKLKRTPADFDSDCSAHRCTETTKLEIFNSSTHLDIYLCFFPPSQHLRHHLHLHLWLVAAPLLRPLRLLHCPQSSVEVALLRHRRLLLAAPLRLHRLLLQEAVEAAASVEATWQLPWQEPNSEKLPR